MWESQVLLTDGQVVFLRVLRFSPTFDERSARYKWNILKRAVKPKSKKKKKKKSHYFIYIFLTSGVKLHIHLLNVVVQFIVFLTFSTLICRGTDISKYFSESLGIRGYESRLYFKDSIFTWRDSSSFHWLNQLCSFDIFARTKCLFNVCSKYSNRTGPDQMQQKAPSDLGLYYLPLIQQF